MLRAAPCLALLLVTSCRPPPRLADVFLITIDTLRADRLGCYGNHAWDEPVSPNIDAFAREAVRFTRMFAPRGLTLPSLTSLHTGVYPITHGVRENDQPWPRRDTLASLLAQHGYTTACFLSYLPGPTARSIAQEFQQHTVTGLGRMRPPSVMQARNDEAALQLTLDHVQKLARASSRPPAFVWLHLYDVHKPYTPALPGEQRFDRDYRGAIQRDAPGDRLDPGDYAGPFTDRAAIEQQQLSAEDHRHVLALYDAGVHDADARVGRLLDTLRQSGLLEDALTIIAADHGDELGDHQHYYYHGASVYDSVMRTALLIRPPSGTTAQRCDALATNVDVLPTVLDWLALPAPHGGEGSSLAAALRGQPCPGHDMVFGEWQDLIGIVRTRDWKYIFNPRGVHPTKPPYSEHPGTSFRVACEELYDLNADALETSNLAGGEPAIASRLREAWSQFRDRPGHATSMSTEFEDNPELKALGYVQGKRADVILDAENCGKQQR
ncbi:MAG: sulfatase [Planctomycetota bacterium]